MYAAGTPVPTLPSGKPRFFLLVQWILIQIHLRTMRSDAGVGGGVGIVLAKVKSLLVDFQP